MKNNNTFTFFWSKNSPFSQFYPTNFVIDNIKYNCAEQYMMHKKAIIFKDYDIADKILNTQKAGKQKKLGRIVKNFDNEKWTEIVEQIVYTGNYAKFTQNKNLLKRLFNTKDTELVEVSPTDIVWGIGLPKNNPKIYDKTKWRGSNKLGSILTKLRNELFNSKKYINLIKQIN